MVVVVEILYVVHNDSEGLCRIFVLPMIGSFDEDLTIAKRRKLQEVWSCLLFIRSGQNRLARQSERGRRRGRQRKR